MFGAFTRPTLRSAAISAVERLPVAGPGRDPRGPAGPNPANPAATGGVRCSASVLRDFANGLLLVLRTSLWSIR